MKRTLILGIGNILLRDEGVGVRVIEAMQDMELPGDVELLDGGTSGADLVDYVADRRKVIVIDAAKMDCKAGTIFRFGLEDLVQKAEGTISLHEFGLLETMTAAKQLGCAPQEVIIFGIEPEVVSPGLELSDKLIKTLPKVIDLVVAEAQN